MKGARAAVRRAVTALVAVVLLGAGATAWEDAADLRAPRAVVLPDLDGRPVELESPVDDAAADVGETDGRVAAPRQGLDVPLRTMAVTGGLLTPPTLTDAYLLRGHGEPALPGSGTTIVAMHAVAGGRAPGNAFVETTGTGPVVTVHPGDPLVVDGVAYTVTSTEVLDKRAATTAPDIWGPAGDGPDRLVVLTCLQRAGSSTAAENLVVHAVRA